jgi:peptidoglycan/xylan/chitin deacetylase (PgdA/CDA1 family)
MPKITPLIFAAAAWFSATLEAAVVLQYHHVDTTTPTSTSTSPERFGMHLDYLADNDFDVVPLAELVDTLRAGEPLPDRTVAISFDDGYVSIYETAWPMLKAKGWPFTVFINSEPHDQGKPLFMSWDQLRELHAGGATIANHTVSHPYLLRPPSSLSVAERKGWIEGEITRAQRRIEAEIGTAPKLFAYPFGEYDNAILVVVEALGYAGFGQQSGPLAPYSDLRALPRFPFGGPYGDTQDFATKVNSLPLPLADDGAVVRWRSESGQALQDIVLPGPTARPVLLLRPAAGFDGSRLACFASGQGRATLERQGDGFRVQAKKPFGTGRARYNCTAPADEAGRFFWYTQFWIIQ